MHATYASRAPTMRRKAKAMKRQCLGFEQRRSRYIDDEAKDDEDEMEDDIIARENQEKYSDDEDQEEEDGAPMDQLVFGSVKLEEGYRAVLPPFYTVQQILAAYRGDDPVFPSQEEWIEMEQEESSESMDDDSDEEWQPGSDLDSEAGCEDYVDEKNDESDVEIEEEEQEEVVTEDDDDEDCTEEDGVDTIDGYLQTEDLGPVTDIHCPDPNMIPLPESDDGDASPPNTCPPSPTDVTLSREGF